MSGYMNSNAPLLGQRLQLKTTAQLRRLMHRANYRKTRTVAYAILLQRRHAR